MFLAACSTVLLIRLALVSAFLAFLIHSKMPRLTEGGKACQFLSAILLAVKASFRSSGSISASTSSKKVQEPSFFACSIFVESADN